jgi:uracil-DNA glycosylase
MNVKEIQEKFMNKLSDAAESPYESWVDALWNTVNSKAFSDPLLALAKEVDNGKKFTPKFPDLLKAYEMCPYRDLKVVIVGQDPYPQEGVADGIAFSCSKTNKEQPSLRYIFDELQRQYPDATRDCDLSRWSKQGVLMLNTALTCEVDNIGAHVNIWKHWSQCIFGHILTDHPKILEFVFMGAKAKPFAKYVPNDHNKHFVAHPAAAAYRGGKWDSDNLFKKINKNLINNGEEPINW